MLGGSWPGGGKIRQQNEHSLGDGYISGIGTTQQSQQYPRTRGRIPTWVSYGFVLRSVGLLCELRARVENSVAAAPQSEAAEEHLQIRVQQDWCPVCPLTAGFC